GVIAGRCHCPSAPLNVRKRCPTFKTRARAITSRRYQNRGSSPSPANRGRAASEERRRRFSLSCYLANVHSGGMANAARFTLFLSLTGVVGVACDSTADLLSIRDGGGDDATTIDARAETGGGGRAGSDGGAASGGGASGAGAGGASGTGGGGA